MGLRLLLVRNHQVLCDIPLTLEGWSKEELERELGRLERNFKEVEDFFRIVVSKNRMRMMRSLLENDDFTLNFVDFMRELELNPKIVYENVNKLGKIGFIEQPSKGEYRFSEFGQAGFLMISLALRRLIQTLEGLEEMEV